MVGAGLLERGQVGARHEHAEAPRRAWCPREQAALDEVNHHAVDRGRRDAEEAGDVDLGRWLTVDLGVVIDEGQILALAVCPSG